MRSDTDLMDFLDSFVSSGVVDLGFEMDGGVYVTISEPGIKEPIEVRAAGSVREGLDKAITAYRHALALRRNDSSNSN
ncbi:MAG: hypothetical protein KGL39_25490 [Patescibacteria group bacterium]|nr:hypothetical protein [Patescibacteria group bacterium]